MLCEVFVCFFCLCFCLSVCDVYWEEKRILESYNGRPDFWGGLCFGFKGVFRLVSTTVSCGRARSCWLKSNGLGGMK